MGVAVMNLGDEELNRIGEYVKAHIVEWLPEQKPAPRSDRELDLIERTIRVEEELKNLGIRMDERFEALQKQMDERFEAVNQRFESINQRFESINQRFEALQKQMDTRFEALQKQMDERFDQVNRRFSSMQWFMAAGFTILALLMSAFQYL